jgi:acetylornithine deacetylase/succinyl-diaminopimelate desuccinylase-like protein
MMGVDQASAWAHAESARFVGELADFVRFPSVGAQAEHKPDMRRCAAWLAEHLDGIGLENAAVVRTGGHPLVYADWLHDALAPTLLVYGHYDVQPAEPFEQWHTPPFQPEVREGRLYGRGASDDKGQMFVHIKAMEAWLRTTGRLPVNVRCIFEGEEEIGSTHLLPLLEGHAAQFASDVALVSDTPMSGPGQPAITYALRGALSVELEVRGPGRDLHSGAYGGAVCNPLQAICELIASLHDGEGRVMLPGFYFTVREWEAAERAYMARSGPSDAELLAGAEAEHACGEREFSLYERITIRPALTVNGIIGGYQGTGAKAVIPARAVAKLNLRLAPDQDPNEVEEQLRTHLRKLAPATVRTTIRRQMASPAVVIDRRHPVMRAAAWACVRGFGRRPRFLRAGGTIPAVAALRTVLNIPVVLLGFALAEDALHGPDESFSLRIFGRAVDTSIAFMAGLRHIAARGVGGQS